MTYRRFLNLGWFLLAMMGGMTAHAQTISITDATVTEGNAGTITATFQVRLSQPSLLPVSVDFATANGTATAGSDYVSTNGTVTFLVGNTNQTISVTVNGDTTSEANETFFVNLSNPFAATIQDNQGLGTITNDDVLPTLSINDVSLSEGNSGTQQAIFTVTLVGPATQTVTVDFATADGTATAGSDYVSTNGVLTFAVGVTSQQIAVTVNGDTENENNETFFVNLSNVTNADISDSQGTGTLSNDDGPSLSIGDVTVTEGNAGTVNAVFVVTMSGPSTSIVTVDYASTNGTATAGSDYQAASGTLSFPVGITSQTISVPVNGDLADEANEAFSVLLSNAQGATITDGEGVGTITDDDAAPSLTVSDATVTEGNAGSTNATFNVFLSAPSSQTVTVDYATLDGTAAAGSDYTAVSGTLTFSPGVTNQSVSVTVAGDTVDEANESFFFTLSNPANASMGDAAGEGTITDDDTASISINDVSVTEGNSGTVSATFNITLSTASAQTVTVDFATANGTATAGSDYSATNGVVTFNPGQTTQSVSVTVTGDTTDESNETFMVNLGNAAGATITDNQGVGTILDDDGASSLSILDASTTEGNSGTTTMTFTVRLLPSSLLPVTVSYTTANGTAVAGSDYIATNGVLTFLAGSTTQTISVSILGDNLDEANETFFVNLSNAVNASIDDGQGVGTIVDNDASSLLTINDVTVVEGNSGTTNAVFLVTLTPASGQTITVDYATQDGTATAGSDYTATSGTLTFAPGVTSQSISVPVIADTAAEIDETFQVLLSNPSQGTIGDPSGTGTITNDDAGSAIVISDSSVQESDTETNLVFTVSLTAASTETVSVDFTTQDGTANDLEDYGAAGGTITFAPGITNQTISISIVGDSIPEFDETFFVNLSNPINATLGDPQGTGTIVNDDSGVAVSINDVEVVEGDEGTTNAVFTLTLSSSSVENISVDYITSSASASEGEDYQGASGTVVFSPGTTNRTIAIVINGDYMTEIGEGFLIDLFNPVNVTISDGHGEGIILDDDPEVDLVLTGMDNPEPVLVGCDLTYMLSLTNASDADAHQVFLTNTIPAGTLFISATSSVGTNTFIDGAVVFDLGTLPAGTNVTMTVVVVPTLEAVGLITASAAVSSAEVDSTAEFLLLETTVENQITTFTATDVVLNGQTGLFEQIVTVTNPSCSVISALRIVVTSLNGDVVVWNASGTNDFAQPYLQHNFGVDPGAVVEFRIEYYSRTRTQPVPEIMVEIQNEVPVEEPTGEEVAVTRTVPLVDGTVLVEFQSRKDRLYVIQYSDDLATWKTANPAVRATSNQTQWIDSGPSKTDKHPREVPVRFYRVFRR